MPAFLLLTDKCNLNCSYCFNNSYPIKNKKKINSFDWIKILNILAKNKINEIILSGGEPLLLGDDLIKIISEANKLNINSLLLTNGNLLEEKILQELKKAGLKNLTISLNELTFADDETKIENVLHFKNNILQASLSFFDFISITILLSNKNFKFINKILSFFKNEKIAIIIQPVFDKDLGLYNLKENEWSDLKLQLSDWTIKYEKYNYVQFIYNLFNNINDYTNPTCFMGNSAFVIDWYADVIPCFHQPQKVCGNILLDNANDIFLNLLYNSENNFDGNCFGLHCISLFFNQI
ncbi:MAG TPA: radical SAM protein [bacterium]|nr:radical SAM protein [bacterium]HOL48323.1 radical SAM protein [bacterium]HPQ18551.1 radical SAM protein [bacterium]